MNKKGDSLKKTGFSKIKTVLRQTVSLLSMLFRLIISKTMEILRKLRTMRRQDIIRGLRSIWRKLFSGRGIIRKFMRKSGRMLNDSGRWVLSGTALFLFFYYFLGAQMAENIDVSTQYKIEKRGVPLFETAESMAFLIGREVDDKMWTPNLPIIFPAYVLDNMPNFQKGIIAGIRDVVATVSDFEQNTAAQKQDAEAALQLLNYPPHIWIMSRQGSLSLAPSANSQYRRAGKELRKFSRDGVFVPRNEDLILLLQKISNGLDKAAADNDRHQLRHSADWLDNKADDLFYYNKGYTFALWQISRVLASDYGELLVRQDVEDMWALLDSSLQTAAEFSPLMVRNGKPDSLFATNHLIMQNNYLRRAQVAAEKLINLLGESGNADTD